jgi:hypothetical protein
VPGAKQQHKKLNLLCGGLDGAPWWCSVALARWQSVLFCCSCGWLCCLQPMVLTTDSASNCQFESPPCVHFYSCLNNVNILLCRLFCHKKLSEVRPILSTASCPITHSPNHTYHFDVVNRWCVLPVLFPSWHRSSYCEMKAVQPSVCQAGNMRQCQAFMGKTSLHAAHAHHWVTGCRTCLHSWGAWHSMPTSRAKQPFALLDI